MDSPSDSSYQEDILKVKQIWNDMKQVQKSTKKQSKNSKRKNPPETNKKQQIPQKPHKQKTTLQKTKSQQSLTHHQKHSSPPDNVITFSTITQPPSHSAHPYNNSNSVQHINTNINSRYMEQHNFKVTLEQKDRQLSLLRVTNQCLKDQVHKLERQVKERDILIERLKCREHELLGATTKFNSENIQALTQSVEYMNYKNDSRRLLKMLQTTQEYQNFAKLGLDDDGVRFLSSSNKKSYIDVINFPSSQSKPEKTVHFCSCNSQFIPEHYFWVPQKVYDFGRDFVKQRRGQTINQAEIELLLYELNKIWREREKRIINSFNFSKALEVGKYRRKLQDANRMNEQNVKRSE